jgi:hypothetical protein
MPDKPVRTIDPIGLIALANVLRFHDNPDCSCELKCVSECSCELKCVSECSCELKCVCDLKDGTNILDLLSNPVFREVVKGLDVNRIKTIEDFMGIVDEIRKKMNTVRPPTRSAKQS